LKGYLKAHFTLPEEYTGVISASFGKLINNKMHSVPMIADYATGACGVPNEILESPAMKNIQMYVWLMSTASKYISTYSVTVIVYGSGASMELNPLPNLTVYQNQEIVQIFADFLYKLNEVQSNHRP